MCCYFCSNIRNFYVNFSLLGAMFPLPRVIYAISSDGLLFKFLSNVSARFKTPLLATVLSGIFAGRIYVYSMYSQTCFKVYMYTSMQAVICLFVLGGGGGWGVEGEGGVGGCLSFTRSGKNFP